MVISSMRRRRSGETCCVMERLLSAGLRELAILAGKLSAGEERFPIVDHRQGSEK
jgi:hypothetical protein